MDYMHIPDVEQSERTTSSNDGGRSIRSTNATVRPRLNTVGAPVFIVTLISFGYYFSTYYSAPSSAATRSSITDLELLLQFTGGQPQLRPCVFYSSEGTKSSVPTNNVRKVIQTSLGNPSAQWSELACLHGMGTKIEESTTFQIPSARIKLKLFSNAVGDSPEIIGFGGAFTQATALNYNLLGEEGKAAFLELMFGSSGLGYSMGRVPINSCDFSVSSYNFDDLDGDFSLSNFDTTVVKDKATISLIKQATEVYQKTGWSKSSLLKLVASPWSPPSWLKKPTPSDPPGALHATTMLGSSNEGGNCLRENVGPQSKYAATWALYISKFITAYKEQNIPIWGITVQNEPEFAAPWEACAYDKEAERDFVKNHLGSIVRTDHPEVKVFVFDHNKDHAVDWTNTLSSVSEFVDGTAYHWYAGGMDRLLDGGVGSANMHRLRAEVANFEQGNKKYLLIGSEACHCPSTGYAGGDLKVGWARAERYAHTILADLAAGSNAWMEWNLLLDAKGGPNHLGNVCDAPILAVPHRAAVDASSTLSSFENSVPNEFNDSSTEKHTVVGETRTNEELNSMGNPSKFIDVGLIVQPMYYYVGHISRHVRPGARALPSIVDQSNTARAFRPLNSVVSGGGMNDLAREGIEATLWPCEGSTRQEWKLDEVGRWKVFGHDWLGKSTTSCLGKEPDRDFHGLLLTSCSGDSAGVFNIITKDAATPETNVTNVNIVLTNGVSHNIDGQERNCLRVQPLLNEGGTNGQRGGAQVTIGDCNDNQASWRFIEKSGEIISNFFDSGDVCLTTGWPFLQVGAFQNADEGDNKNVVIVLNEANDPANFVLEIEGEIPILSASIPAHSIQTILMK